MSRSAFGRLRVVLLVAFLSLISARAEKLALVSATAIDPATGTVTSDAALLIDRDKIGAVGSREKISIPSDARRIDCKGKFIIPGLWDMHVHIAGLTADPKWSRDSLLPLLLAHGVTGVRDMGGNLAALLRWRSEIEEGKIVGPRIVACGPFLADAKPGTDYTLSVANAAEARRAVQQVKNEHGDFVKILTRLSRESYFAIADEAKRQHLDFVGHIPDTITATEAADAGQKSIEHIFYSNLAFDCSSRETELRQQRAEAAARKDFAALAKIRTAAEESFDPKKAVALWQTFRRNKTWVCPTLVAIQCVAHQRDLAGNATDPRLAYIPPELRAQWTPAAIEKDFAVEAAKWWSEQAAFDLKVARSMHIAGVPVLAGTDSLDPFNYPGSSLHEELKLLVQAGFTPMDALQTATINPARFLQRDTLGALEPNHSADLVILDANPLENIANTQRIQAVVKNGRFFDRADLDRLLEQARWSTTHR